jgi:hypothetical protein
MTGLFIVIAISCAPPWWSEEKKALYTAERTESPTVALAQYEYIMKTWPGSVEGQTAAQVVFNQVMKEAQADFDSNAWSSGIEVLKSALERYDETVLYDRLAEELGGLYIQRADKGAVDGEPLTEYNWLARAEREFSWTDAVSNAKIRERKLRLIATLMSTDEQELCYICSEDSGVGSDGNIEFSPSAVCQSLVNVKKTGSTQGERDTLTGGLKEEGYSQIYGYIVARISEGVYEAAWLQYNYFGTFPSSSHFILNTTITNYSSKGRFGLWAKKLGTHTITTTDGFEEDWDIYQENEFGTAVQEVYDAPAGEGTSDAAGLALLSYCLDVAL